MIVAHYDHGIRPDSASDREFVQNLAARYALPFVYDSGRLGPKASEALARNARYAFLRKVKSSANAGVIATAHHEDDLLETAILNLLRGTGRKGLSSLRSNDEFYRPLLSTPKVNIRKYATKHNLTWREDSTNTDTNYLRNYVRHNIMTRFDAPARARLRLIIDSAASSNDELDSLLRRQLDLQPNDKELMRSWFIALPHAVAREVIAAWLRSSGISDFDRKGLERIVVQAKTLPAGKRIDVSGKFLIAVRAKSLSLQTRSL